MTFKSRIMKPKTIRRRKTKSGCTGFVCHIYLNIKGFLVYNALKPETNNKLPLLFL